LPSCPECLEIKKKFDWLTVAIISSWSLLLILILLFILISFREKERKKLGKISLEKIQKSKRLLSHQKSKIFEINKKKRKSKSHRF